MHRFWPLIVAVFFMYKWQMYCLAWILVRTHLVNLTSPFALFRTFLSLTVIFVCFVKSPRRRSRSRSPSPKRGYRDHDKSRRRSRSPAHHRYMYTYMTITRRLWAVYYLLVWLLIAREWLPQVTSPQLIRSLFSTQLARFKCNSPHSISQKK